MVMTDPIADMLTRIRNALMAKHEQVEMPSSKMKLEIARILKHEGYIKNYKVIQDGKKSYLRIFLKYDSSNKPVIHGLKRISKPGRRVYTGYKEIPRVLNGYGTIIITTSSGVTTGSRALEKKVGGELICSIW